MKNPRPPTGYTYKTRNHAKNKGGVFSDDFGLRSPVIQKNKIARVRGSLTPKTGQFRSFFFFICFSLLDRLYLRGIFHRVGIVCFM